MLLMIDLKLGYSEAGGKLVAGASVRGHVERDFSSARCAAGR